MSTQISASHHKSDRIGQAFELVADQLGQVKKLINEQLIDCDKSIGGLLKNFDVCSGKMLRPGLVLLSGAACGEITNQHIRIAAISEMIHNATLLHDDVIDEAKTRRDIPTVNALKGNESAVLLGDFLLGRVFRMCTDLEPSVVKIVAETTVRTCDGELKQLIEKRNWRLSEEQYIHIITEKTAAFFAGCCQLGAISAKANNVKVKALKQFGRNLGIAFQITDDLLDIIGDEHWIGKTLGTDADKNKLTLAVIHLLSTTDKKEKQAITKILTSKINRENLVEMLKSSGSIEYTRRNVTKFIAEAISDLKSLPQTKAKTALSEVALFVADRAA